MKRVMLVLGMLAGSACGVAGDEDGEDVQVATATPQEDQEALQGGTASSAYPAVGMLLTQDGAMCTGSLIRPRVVLTAGHCAQSRVVGFYTGRGAALRNGVDVDVALENMQEHAVVDQAVHPQYRPGTCGTSPDLALLLLEDAPGITPVRTALARGVTPGETCRVVGFGEHGSGRSATHSQKRSGTSTVVEMDALNISVRANTAVADHGDSGGPLLCSSRLVGVTSCGPPGAWQQRRVMYARADAGMSWMQRVVASWGA